jgi:hypothetical protein
MSIIIRRAITETSFSLSQLEGRKEEERGGAPKDTRVFIIILKRFDI